MINDVITFLAESGTFSPADVIIYAGFFSDIKHKILKMIALHKTITIGSSIEVTHVVRNF